MSIHTIPERIFIVKTFYESNKSPVNVARTFAKEFKVHSDFDQKTIIRLIEEFVHTGSVCDNMSHNVGQKAIVSTPDNVENAREVLARSPWKSIRRKAQEVGIKQENAAKPHRTSNIFDLIKEHFLNRVTALGYLDRIGMVFNWPHYSPDFKQYEWFLWGNLKDKVYSQNPKKVSELKCVIQRLIEVIEVPTVGSVIRFVLRMRHAIARDGRYVELGISEI
ncbi:uncharacterized protein NPIL_636591 [Nephila pilipes]|uniref:DUF4817 domain-containing protein n=1 Tax=Nephila pilipes TaxID=299642 RepID=A0A8X6PAD4_NEPPI|nr:uncharacterized protein NPIL_636591 [Nephila pilipes]